MAAAGREAFAGWCAVIARALVRDGFGKAEAKRLSTLTVSSLEGALILARVEASARPIEEVASALGAALQIKTSRRKRLTAS
jgi:TetR/AcrR family transcriptional repressor of lmrAB and yxaGH operons